MNDASSLYPLRTLTHTLAAALILVASSAAFATESPVATEEEQTLYAIGSAVSRSLSVFELSPAEFAYVIRGLSDAQAGRSPAGQESYTGKIQELAKTRRKAAGERQVAAGKGFLEAAAKEKGAALTRSGMVYQELAAGKGAPPRASDVVVVNYRGTLADGREFDSSYKRGKPLEFQLDKVIKCWTEGVQQMKPGGKARLVCPPQLAYGDKGAGDMILPGATLAFEVELVEVKPAPVPDRAGASPATAAAPTGKEDAKSLHRLE